MSALFPFRSIVGVACGRAWSVGALAPVVRLVPVDGVNIPDRIFEGAQRVLDVGGWFKPEPRATHVVDLMPWETRRAHLSLQSLPEERFNKDTWFQADFLKPDFKLPFADRFFDLVVCGHTVEDLVAPEALLLEMQRVALRGVIECPSRITEQTLGIRDRESTRCGHPHHHWVVDSKEGVLLLYSKESSDLSASERTVPLDFTESYLANGHGESVVIHPWTGKLEYRFVTGSECRRQAEDFRKSLSVPRFIRTKDRILRLARRARSKLQGRTPENLAWWPKIVELSRPYSRIELK